jgi:hypothetical protein
MRGRSCCSLLAVLIVTLPVALAHGQAVHGQAVHGESARGQGLPGQATLEPTGRTNPVEQIAAEVERSFGRAVRPPTIERNPLLPPVGPARPVSGTIRFPVIAQAAETIFSGTVTGIVRRPATRGQAIETVAITFHVEQAIRGATPGENFTLSQWIGLWSSGQRYHVGERVLLFLYPPSKLGLTSCVGASMGRFAIDPAGRVLLSTKHLAAFRTDPVLGGKAHVRLSDFALAVRRASEEE